MTREEAIVVLKEIKNYFGRSIPHLALDMAIAALREQETVTNRNGLNRTESDTVKGVDSDQFEGCEYCTPVLDEDGFLFGKDFERGGGNIAGCIRWHNEDVTLHIEAFEVKDGVEVCKDYSDTPISTCPMCGRRLEEV